MRVITAFESEELVQREKLAVMINILYSNLPKDIIRQAIEQAIKFLNAGEETKSDDDSGTRVYSFSHDANFIFSAFRQTHDIDLEQIEYLHWWKFLALFMDLGSDTAFCSLVNLRRRVKTGVASKEEWKLSIDLGDIFDLPELDLRTPDQKARAADFMRRIGKGNE